MTGLGGGRLGTRAQALDPERTRIEREQSAVRRVTTLAARGASSAEIFDAVTGELGHIIGAQNMLMWRRRPDGTGTIAASWSARGDDLRIFPVGATILPCPDGVTEMVLRTGRPARRNYTPAQIDEVYLRSPVARELGVRSGAACPIVVGGRLWGTLVTHFGVDGIVPDGVEDRMLGFLELVAVAIANAEGRAELAASRARLVATADASRRRIERDLHDGAQQRLVRLVLSARMAADEQPGSSELRVWLSDLATELTGVLDELREISHGLHPAILSRGGLKAALTALARRSTVPVTLDVRLGGRVADGVEVAVHYVVSEALTNAAKHAGASRVHVELDDADGETLALTVRDDGAGGADLGGGHGLIGLQDRVEALGGRFDVSSPVGQGTTLTARIPIEERPSG